MHTTLVWALLLPGESYQTRRFWALRFVSLLLPTLKNVKGKSFLILLLEATRWFGDPLAAYRRSEEIITGVGVSGRATVVERRSTQPRLTVLTIYMRCV